ncbi:hypothetical protein JI435_200270, partial [Parastagonospora nodorum SN15]
NNPPVMARKVNKTPGLRPPITLHSPQPTFDTGRSVKTPRRPDAHAIYHARFPPR